MEANELRIGNYLQDNVTKTTIKVVELTNECITTYVIDRSKFPLKDGWKLEPIPLTEEWLLKFGFKTTTVLKMSDGFILNGNILFKGEDSFRYFGTTTKIKYIHQLQNLYFALTNEELTLKTEKG